MKKKILTLFMVFCTTVTMNIPVCATVKDSELPSKFVALTSYVKTDVRQKDNDTSHYVKNDTMFALKTLSKGTDGKDYTVNGTATVPKNTIRLVRNWIYEKGPYYDSKKTIKKCYLQISTTSMSEQGTLKGYWSPDSVGTYPNAN